MVTSHFSEESLTPSDMNLWLKKNNGYQDDWEGNTYFGEVILIRFYLENAIPVIAEVLYKGEPHFVVLTGYDANGFIMNDPEFPHEHYLNNVYNISDEWGTGPSRNIYGIRILYPAL